jgi:hypothetical protein
MPPWKEVYKNDLFKFDKPILVISNKYCDEWGNKPITFLDFSCLYDIFSMLKDKYKIIYSRLGYESLTRDNSNLLDLDEHQLIKDVFGNDVTLIQELYYSNQYLSKNTVQLMVYANCENFISVCGGGAMLASVFGGKNLIYVRYGELLRCNAYDGWMKKLSNVDIKWVLDAPKIDDWDYCRLNKPKYDKFLELIEREYA